MSLDPAPLAQMVAEFIDDLEENHDGRAELGVVGLVVEVNTDGDDEDDPGSTWITYRCSDPRRWIQVALFQRAAVVVDQSSEEAG